MQKTIVVLGMHRSGSSIAGAILQSLGVDMGHDAFGRTSHNPTGHFEDEAVVRINNAILREAGGRWDDPPSTALIDSAAPRYEAQMRTVCQRSAGLVGFKDPRLCLTMRHWRQHCLNPHLVICTRRADETARSLLDRNGIPIEQGIALAERYTREVAAFLEACPSWPRLVLPYEDLVGMPEVQVRRIASFLGVEASAARVEQAVALVVPRRAIAGSRLRHLLKRGLAEPGRIPAFVRGRIKVWLRRRRPPPPPERR